MSSRVRFRAATLLAGWTVSLLAPWVASAEDTGNVFRAGASAVDVSPAELPVLVNGGFQSRTADKIVDRLHARCLILDDGVERIALVVVDSCMMPRKLLDEAKRLASAQTEIRPDRIMISATHTHSAPAVMGCLGTEADARYAATLPARIAKAIQIAEQNLSPARIGWAVQTSDENVFIRRFEMKPGTALSVPFTGVTHDRAQMNPGFQNADAVRRTGTPDTDLTVLSVQTRSGQPLAMLANYSTHYAGAPAVSADYFGVFCERVAELMDAGDSSPPFVATMSNGTSGDANCIDFTKPPRQFDRFSVAEDLAQDALAAYRRIEHYDWAPLAMEERLLEVNARVPTEEEITAASAHLETNAPDGKLTSITDVYAHETLLLAEMPPVRELKLQAIRVGTLGIATFPNEVFSSTGLRVKRASPFETTFNIELANGAEGYIPPPEQHALGGYTTWRARTSCLAVDAEPRIAAAALELLRTVSEKGKGSPPLREDR